MTERKAETDGLFAGLTCLAVAWTWTAEVWIVQILAARHGYHWPAWHLAGYLAVYGVLASSQTRMIAQARIKAIWIATLPEVNVTEDECVWYLVQAAITTIAYVAVRSL